MKKLLRLTKTLLVAAGLLAGGNAWADSETEVYSQDFEDAETYNVLDTYSTDRATVSQQSRTVSAGTSKYMKVVSAGNGTTVNYTSFASSSSYTSCEKYRIEFDFGISTIRQSGSSTQTQTFFINSGSTNLIRFTNSSSNYSTSSTANVFLGSNSTETPDGTIAINSSFTANPTTFYHATISASESGTKLTLDDGVNDPVVYNLNAGFVKIDKLAYATGKSYGAWAIDNMSVVVISDQELVGDPEIALPVYAEENRTVTITSGTSSLGNTVHTYYTTNGEDPTADDTEYTESLTISSDCTIKAITISSTGVTSGVVSRAITVGKLTLKEPSISFSSLKQSGTYYYPIVSVSCDNSSILGTPVASLSATLNGNAISITDGKITITEPGTLVVNATAATYNSSSKTYAASRYQKVLSFDLDNAEAMAAMGYTTAAGSETLYSKEMNYYTLQSNITDYLDGGYASGKLYEGYGIYTGSSGNTDLKFKDAKVSEGQIAHFVLGRFSGSNAWTVNYNEHWKIATENIRQTQDRIFLNLMELYEPVALPSLAEGEAVRLTFENGGVSGDNNNNWNIDFFNNGLKISNVRADWFDGPNETGSNANFIYPYTFSTDGGATPSTGDIWANFQSDMTDADIDLTVSYSEGVLYVVGTMTHSPRVYYVNYKKTGISGDIAFNLFGNNGATLSNIDMKMGVTPITTAAAHAAALPVTITEAGYATLVSSYDLDFSGAASMKAYKVKVNEKAVATLTPVNEAPAGTPLLLIGSSENIAITSDAAEVTGNDLVAGTGAPVATVDGAYTNMILNKYGDKACFMFAAGQTVAADKAYLHFASSLAPDVEADARMTVVFFDDVTGISSVKAEKVADGQWYNLAGQRVMQPTKGLYIVNGKKVSVK